MGRSATLEVKGDDVREVLNRFWRRLLTECSIDALLIPLELPSRANVVPALVHDPKRLEQADVLAPVMPVSSARIISAMTKVTPLSRKVAAILRPCEIRALIELVKLKQASLENLIIIGIDCLGTYSQPDYARRTKEERDVTGEFLRMVREGKEDPNLREACRICEYPIPQNSDLTLGLMGVDLEERVIIQADGETGEEILDELGLGDEDGGERRKEAISQLIAQRAGRREEFFEENRGEISGMENLASIFAPCIRCYNCRTACPLCYCRECFFDSPTFELEAERYLSWAEARGAIRMPTDTLFFHLTRMAHMTVCCVGCGLCEEACPNDIPLFKIFKIVGFDVQKLFNYVPGRSLEEELPLTTFREDELQGV